MKHVKNKYTTFQKVGATYKEKQIITLNWSEM